MGKLDLYLLNRATRTVGGLIVFALVVLLLERLLRIFEVVSTSSRPASDASQMVLNLLPHYLGIAIPMALMLGIIITVDRLSKSSELVSALGAGVSLTRLSRPFMLIAAVLALATILIEGWLQPLGRYNYRAVEDSIRQTSFAAVLREGTFTTVGDRTFFAGTDLRGADIGPVFIYERLFRSGEPDNQSGVRITTAERGQLEVRDDSGEPVLQLAEGQTYQLMQPSARAGSPLLGEQLLGRLSFERSAITSTAQVEPFRARGDDNREMTSRELWENRASTAPRDVPVTETDAALHARIGRVVVLLIIPFVAVPFGLNYGRNPSSAGIFVGVVLLVALQKAMEFAQNLGADGTIPAGSGIWAIVGAFALLGGALFRASAIKMGQPPLTAFQQAMADFQKMLRARFARPAKPVAAAA